MEESNYKKINNTYPDYIMPSINKGYEYAKDYFTSEGYDWRFNNLGETLEQFKGQKYFPKTESDGTLELSSDNINDYLKDVIYIENLKDNGVYIGGQGSFIGDDFYKGKTVAVGNLGPVHPLIYGRIAAHEAAHGKNNSIKLYLNSNGWKERVNQQYANIYSIFRNNKEYQKLSKFLGNDSIYLDENPQSFEFDNHDAMPDESYGDLVGLRFELNELGIFDSRVKGSVATIDHIKKYKEIMAKEGIELNRLFKNFSDEDIVWMLNYVAQNKERDNNLLGISYASKGRRLIRRKSNW